jgi:hypothetical protein
MALDAIRAEMDHASMLDEELANDEPEPPPADASRVERRISELQNLATSERHFRELLRNEGLPEDIPFLGNPERARARKRLRERSATMHPMSEGEPSALQRIEARIKSFAETISNIVNGIF